MKSVFVSSGTKTESSKFQALQIPIYSKFESKSFRCRSFNDCFRKAVINGHILIKITEFIDEANHISEYLFQIQAYKDDWPNWNHHRSFGGAKFTILSNRDLDSICPDRLSKYSDLGHFHSDLHMIFETFRIDRDAIGRLDVSFQPKSKKFHQPIFGYGFLDNDPPDDDNSLSTFELQSVGKEHQGMSSLPEKLLNVSNLFRCIAHDLSELLSPMDSIRGKLHGINVSSHHNSTTNIDEQLKVPTVLSDATPSQSNVFQIKGDPTLSESIVQLLDSSIENGQGKNLLFMWKRKNKPSSEHPQLVYDFLGGKLQLNEFFDIDYGIYAAFYREALEELGIAQTDILWNNISKQSIRNCDTENFMIARNSSNQILKLHIYKERAAWICCVKISRGDVDVVPLPVKDIGESTVLEDIEKCFEDMSLSVTSSSIHHGKKEANKDNIPWRRGHGMDENNNNNNETPAVTMGDQRKLCSNCFIHEKDGDGDGEGVRGCGSTNPRYIHRGDPLATTDKIERLRGSLICRYSLDRCRNANCKRFHLGISGKYEKRK